MFFTGGVVYQNYGGARDDRPYRVEDRTVERSADPCDQSAGTASTRNRKMTIAAE
jgi:hypothetical protein